jgi:hypothetical protein
MVLPPPLDDLEAVRPYFRRLRELRDRALGERLLAAGELSMGMSHDFEAAIEEGRDARARRDRDLRREAAGGLTRGARQRFSGTSADPRRAAAGAGPRAGCGCGGASACRPART